MSKYKLYKVLYFRDLRKKIKKNQKKVNKSFFYSKFILYLYMNLVFR